MSSLPLSSKPALAAVAALLTLSMYACGLQPTATKSGPRPDITIKVGDVIAPQEPTNVAAAQWAKKVATDTGGHLNLQIFPNSQLGADTDTAEQARLGAPVIGYTSPDYLTKWIPDFAILQGPYLFTDDKQVGRVMSSSLVKGWEAELVQKAGLRVLAFNWYFGQRELVATKPVREPSDLAGLKIRVPPSPMWIDTFKAMGATPTPMSFAEVYPGIQQGVVNGAEAPLSTIYGSKLEEAAKYVSLTHHFTQVNAWIIGEKFWESLPADYQKALTDEAVKSGEYETKLTVDSAGDYEAKLKQAGAQLVPSDVPAFQRVTKVVYTEFPNWTPGLYDKIVAIRDGKSS